MATTFVTEGQHRGMVVSVSSPKSPALLCLGLPVLGEVEVPGSLLAVWEQGYRNPGTGLPLLMWDSSDVCPKALTFLRV